MGRSPQSILAAGGKDYYPDRESYDNVMAILTVLGPAGAVRGTCQVLTTTSGGPASHFEQLMGTEGTIRISENPQWTRVFREAHAPDWEPWVTQGLLVKEAAAAPAPKDPAQAKPEDPNEVRVRETGKVTAYELPVVLDYAPHQPHLVNFFRAVRGQGALACPADQALRGEVVVHKIHEAVAAARDRAEARGFCGVETKPLAAGQEVDAGVRKARGPVPFMPDPAGVPCSRNSRLGRCELATQNENESPNIAPLDTGISPAVTRNRSRILTAVAPLLAFLSGPVIATGYWGTIVYIVERDLYATSYERLEAMWPALATGIVAGVIGSGIVVVRMATNSE